MMADANSSGVVTRRSGVAAAIISNTASGVALLASVACSRPPDSILTLMPNCPKSCAAVRVNAKSAALAAV